MSKKHIHVVPRGGSWAVRREGANGLAPARDPGRRDRVEVVEHGRDGRIRDSDSYGRDPFPPRDNKH
jgi:hypothetical protein